MKNGQRLARWVLALLVVVAFLITLQRAIAEPSAAHMRGLLGLMCLTLAGLVGWRRLPMSGGELYADIRASRGADVITGRSVVALCLLGALLLFLS